MRRILSAFFLICLSLSASPLFAQTPKLHFDGASWWDYVKVLADDNMEGRETGSAGLRRAQAYVVEQLTKNGVEPAGVDGYYQPIKFVKRQVNEQNSAAALVCDGKSELLTPGDDFFFSSRSENSDKDLSASLVFVGYGLKIPEKNLDELAGHNLSGKIVVFINGSPSDLPAALASHYSTIGERWKSLRAAGVIASSRFPIPPPWIFPGLASPSTACSLPWTSPARNLTKRKVSNLGSPSIPLPRKNFSPAAVTPSPNLPLSPKTASLSPLFPSLLRFKPTSRSSPAKSNPPTSSQNFPAPIPLSKMNSSYFLPTSTTSASAPPSTATISITAPWTTLPAAPSSSTSPPVSKPIPKSSVVRSSSSSSPGKKKVSSARATLPNAPPSRPNP